MATEVLVPVLGESISEATLGEWLKKPGEAVAADEPIASLETDKVSVEVPAPAAGVMGQHAVQPGDTVNVGAMIGTIEAGDAQALAQAGLAVGDRVCALLAGGGYAELCVAPIAQCLPVPNGLPDEEGASLPETFFTVWTNVFERSRLAAGETLFEPVALPQAPATASAGESRTSSEFGLKLAPSTATLRSRRSPPSSCLASSTT